MLTMKDTGLLITYHNLITSDCRCYIYTEKEDMLNYKHVNNESQEICFMCYGVITYELIWLNHILLIVPVNIMKLLPSQK